MISDVSPLISVIVPTFARPARLRACLEGLTAQTFDRRQFEVVVVDDGGPEPIDRIVADFQPRVCLRGVRQRRVGPGGARNRGAAEARGRFIAFIDDDCVPDPEWLAALVEALSDDPAALWGGPVVNAVLDNPRAAASGSIAHFVYDYYARPEARERFFSAANMGVAIEPFREMGGFRVDMPAGTAEDKEFCDRWSSHGLSLVHAPRAIVHNTDAPTVIGFFRQHFNYGRGIFAFRRVRRARERAPVVPEPIGFYVALVTSPLRRPRVRRPWTVAGFILLSQVATTAGALFECFRRTPASVQPIPAVPPRSHRADS